MKQLFFASIITLCFLSCGQTPGTGSDSPNSPSGPSEKNSGLNGMDTSAGGGETEDSSQIRVMSTDSSQLKASSDSARARQKTSASENKKPR